MKGVDFPYVARRLPVVLTDEGNPTTYHRTADGLIGDAVTEETATHTLVTTVTLEPKS